MMADGTDDGPRLRRPPQRRVWHPMPEFVREALLEQGLMTDYEARPPYQQNDYVGWITGARRVATREKRLAQMLDELAGGERYMHMAYRPREGGRLDRRLKRHVAFESPLDRGVDEA